MAQNEMMDSQQQNQGSTPTEPRHVECKACGQGFTEIWTLTTYQEYELAGVKRKISLLPECVERWVSDRGECKDCKQAREAKELIALRLAETLSLQKKCIELIGGEKPFKEFRFDSYQPRNESQRQALGACSHFDPSSENLLIIGPTGAGKTHLACATVLNHAERSLAFERHRITELLRVLRYERKAEDEEKYIRRLAELPILLIEDLGAQKTTDWAGAMLWEIIDRRLEKNQNGLIITSNLGRGKLAESMGDRVPSRLSGICKVITIDGEDFRLQKPLLLI
jgi:DNA replication protein DnaC